MKKTFTFILANVLFATMAFADAFTGGTKIYLSTNDFGDWNNDGAKLAAWFFNGTGADAFSGFFTQLGTSKFFEATVPGAADVTYNSVIFARMADDAVAPDWGAKWNQTATLSADGHIGKCYYVKSYDDSGNDEWGDLLWFDGAPSVQLLYSNQDEEGVQTRDLGQFTSSFDCTAAGDGTTTSIQLGGTVKPNFAVDGQTTVIFGYSVISEDVEVGGNEIVLTAVGDGTFTGIENVFSHFTATPSTNYGIQFWFKYTYAGFEIYESNNAANYKLHFTTPESLPTSVSNPSATKAVKSIEYFTVSGQKTTENVQGLLIKKTIYNDGEVKTDKILR